MRCLERNPQDRYHKVQELRAELEICLIGAQGGSEHIRLQAQIYQEALRQGERFRSSARQRRHLARELAERELHRLPQASTQYEEVHWALRQRFKQIEFEVEHSFESACAHLLQLLEHSSKHQAAREKLRDLYWYRFLEAERLGHRAEMLIYLPLLRHHDPRQGLRVAIKGEGSLKLSADPPKSWVHLQAVQIEGREWRSEALKFSGEAPLMLKPLPMGSYLLQLQAPGYHPLLLSFSISRQETAELHLPLLPEGRLPSSCVYVPGGIFWSGASSPEIKAPLRQRRRLPGFLLMKTPITQGEYASFLNALLQGGERSKAQRHQPQGGGWREGKEGCLYPQGPLQNPVTGIRAQDAEAYARWRGDQEQLSWRLPSALEWECAARGADGRAYPWGNQWEPSFCRCAESPEGGALSAVGEEQDRSLYGISDLSGGVREWTADRHPEEPRYRVVKGGGFASQRPECHLGAWRYQRSDRPAEDLGFRLALDAQALLRPSFSAPGSQEKLRR